MVLAVRRRKFVATTDSAHGFVVYPNLAEHLIVNDLNQLWVADITYVRLLAEHLVDHLRFREALAGPRLEMIVKAAPLHDIGKVGIPDQILRKPGPLDAAEWAVMRTHAALGSDALERASLLRATAVAIMARSSSDNGRGLG